MITFLSGGTGTPKLLLGMKNLIEEKEIAVVVNTAEDIWISGNHLSPDLDTVMYLFSGELDTKKWWGLIEDSFVTHDTLQELGYEEFIKIGDRDRAVHIARGKLLTEGLTLTQATRLICRKKQIMALILPMCDSEVTTMVRTPRGLCHFQEFWVKYHGEDEVLEVIREFSKPPIATKEVISTIESSDAVVIGPSNPVSSILPILECEGVRKALSEVFVIGISPFIGRSPVSGPAGILMQSIGLEPDSLGTLEAYDGLIDLFIHDIRDTLEIKDAVKTDTLMVNAEKSRELGRFIMDVIRNK